MGPLTKLRIVYLREIETRTIVQTSPQIHKNIIIHAVPNSHQRHKSFSDQRERPVHVAENSTGPSQGINYPLGHKFYTRSWSISIHTVETLSI
jgi:hypothetical protein